MLTLSGPRVEDDAMEAEVKMFSHEEREAIVQDVSGTTPPVLLRHEEWHQLLLLMEEELLLIPEEEKAAFQLAQQNCPEIANAESERIKFLQASRLDPHATAHRIVGYWNTRFELFGDDAFEPITLEHLEPNEIRILETEGFRILSITDEGGRGLLLVNRSLVPSRTRERRAMSLRVLFYVLEVASENKFVQVNGLSFIVYFSEPFHMEHFDGKMTRRILGLLTKHSPIRCCSGHCLYSSFVITTLVPLLRAALGKELRHRFLFHGGTNKEVLEKLKACGIPKAAVPMSRGGDLVPGVASWLEERRRLEATWSHWNEQRHY